MGKNSISLYKVGKFYNAFGDDGWILHELLGYKFVEYKQCVGFPESAFSKVKGWLEEKKISYEVYEKDILVSKYKGINKNYNTILKKALQNSEIEKRINRLKRKIDECNTEELELILEGIEDGKFSQR